MNCNEEKGMSMSSDETRFWELVDELIEFANTRSENDGPDMVNSAMQYASARFSAFVVASNTDNLEDEKPEALRFLTNHYREVLDDNLTDFLANPIEKIPEI